MARVFVGLSGGVDSSVAALRLKEQGHDVTGVFIKVWHPEWLTCNWEEERLDAMRVAARLDIPFLTCDAEAAYRDEVADYFIESYKMGYTPNPDVLCNQHVKFGAFLTFAKGRRADFVATGHYAQKVESNARFELHRGKDANKDQSYFLWTLSQDQLVQTLFPVGDTQKDKIRAEAARAGLITSEKKDSQGICFLGHIDIKEFLSHYAELEPGDVLDESGHPIGRHEGSIIYTLGQRHGFSVTTQSTAEKPHFIIKKNIRANTITVSTEKPSLPKANEIVLVKSNWISAPPEPGDTIQIQTRYRQTPTTVIVSKIDGEHTTLTTTKDSEAVAAGQSCVCYLRDHCLGGGIIVS